jgi:hypothetical protein
MRNVTGHPKRLEMLGLVARVSFAPPMTPVVKQLT